ncbi:MAG: hypothetical protein PHU91_00615, partial [Candidatus Omnitrophica bacterium]|nr:hypothetical protein [Candidatus Omnitrophota bacterium]
MKNWIKVILAALLLLFLSSLICLHVLVNLKGKDLLIASLSKALKRQVKIASLTTSFPANVHIRDLKVEGLFSVNEVYLYGGMLNIFRKNLRFPLVKLIHPEVDINLRSNIEKPALPAPAAAEANTARANAEIAVSPQAPATQPAPHKIAVPKFSV